MEDFAMNGAASMENGAVMNGAAQEHGATNIPDTGAGAPKEQNTAPISGEELFGRYEKGASLDELNELIGAGQANTPERVQETNNAPTVGGTPQSGEKSLNADDGGMDVPNVSEGAQEGAGKAAPAQKLFSQKDVDRFIGQRIGEEQRKRAAFMQDVAHLMGVDVSNVEEAVRRQRLEAEAESQGIEDKELYARARALEEQNERMTRQAAQEEYLSRKLGDLKAQSAAAGVDLVALSDNDAFVAAVNNFYANEATRSAAVQMAYNAVFFNDALQKHIQAEREKIISTVKAGAARMDEGASQGAQGVSSKVDVSKMSDEQIADIANRVMRGEKIVL